MSPGTGTTTRFGLYYRYNFTYAYRGLPKWLSGKESAYNAEATGDVGLIPRSESSPREGHGNHSSILAWRIP